MEQKKLNFTYSVCAKSELTDADAELVDAACAATFTSYAPYSNFKVGAAIRLSNGEIVSGSNQENAAFGAGTCAERCALFFAHANWPEETVCSIAVAARGANDEYLESPISPCGICRQALIEAQTRAGKDVRVLMVGRHEIITLKSVSHLLPFQFDEIV